MVGGDGVGDVLHQDGFTRLGLCHDEGALSFADGSKEVYHAGRERVAVIASAKRELLIGEERGKVLERNAVAHESRVASVDFGDLHQGEIFFAFLGRADYAVYYVTRLQAEELDLRLGHIDVVRRREVVVIGGAEEAVAVLHDFQHTGAAQDVVKFVGFFHLGRFAFGLIVVGLTLLGLAGLVVAVVIVVVAVDAWTGFFGCHGRKIGHGGFGCFKFANQFGGELHVFCGQVFDGDEVVRAFSEGWEVILAFCFGLILRFVVCDGLYRLFRLDFLRGFGCSRRCFLFSLAGTSRLALRSSRGGRRFLRLLFCFAFSLTLWLRFLGRIVVGGVGFRRISFGCVSVLGSVARPFLLLHLALFFQFVGCYFLGCPCYGLFVQYLVNKFFFFQGFRLFDAQLLGYGLQLRQTFVVQLNDVIHIL